MSLTIFKEDFFILLPVCRRGPCTKRFVDFGQADVSFNRFDDIIDLASYLNFRTYVHTFYMVKSRPGRIAPGG